MKKIVLSVVAIVLAVGLVGGGAFAYLNDTETSTGNTFTAGTLDLKVDGGDVIIPISESDLMPGWSATYIWELKNVGSVPGHVTVEVGPITVNDCGCTEPENDAEVAEYGSATCGNGQGELARFIRTKFSVSIINPPPECPGRAGPCKWCQISYTAAYAHTGYRQDKDRYYGLRHLDGLTMMKTGFGGYNLGQDDTMLIRLELSLDENIRKVWPGVWYDIDDNVIQSDSVEFDIIFHLDQVP